MGKYITWDYTAAGISFCEDCGRITVFKKTLEALGFPAYYRFLFDPDKCSFAVQTCEMEDEGSHKLPKFTKRECCEIKSLALVKFIYQTCRWNSKVSYRISGAYQQEHNLVHFNLAEALEIHEGRLVESEQ